MYALCDAAQLELCDKFIIVIHCFFKLGVRVAVASEATELEKHS